MRALSFVVLLLSPALAWCQSVTLPAEVRGAVNEFIRVSAVTDCKEVRWLQVDAGLSLFPVDLLKDSKTAVVVSSIPGRYRLYAYTAKGDVPSLPVVCTVIVGDAPPGPGPVPPGPTPPPVPPAPSVLAAALAPAWKADKEAGEKVEDMKKLADLYRDGVDVVDDEALKTVQDVYAVMVKASQIAKLRDRLPKLRKAVADYLDTQLPRNVGTALDKSKRQLFAEEFGKVATALEELSR